MLAKFFFALTILVGAVWARDSDGSMAQPYDTIVIGLGSSGVTAAATLARAGRRVLALEAQGRVGGRVHSAPFGDGVVELGAEWIHGSSQNSVYDLAIQNNISLIAQELELEAFRSDGSRSGQELKDYLKEKRPEVLEDKDFLEQFLAFINSYVNCVEGSNNWNDVNALKKYEELSGPQHMSWHKYGYNTLFDILLNKYNNGRGLPTLETKLSTEVTQIVWPQDPTQNVIVKCKDGAEYTANTVIVTVSLGVLKERHTTLFSPPLSQEKKTAIDNIAFGAIVKVFLSFPYVWWHRDNAQGFVWRGEDRKQVGVEDWTTEIVYVSSPLGVDDSLTFWMGGDVAKLVETLPEDVVKRKCMELLRRFMGANTTIPEPTAILRSTWFTNPYTRGSYSYDNVLLSKYPNARRDLGAPLTDSAGRPRMVP